MIHVTVNNKDVGTRHVFVDENSLVEKVKMEIKETTGISIDRQELFYCGKQLLDNQCLSSLGMTQSAEVFLSINVRSSRLKKELGDEVTICVSDNTTEHIFSIDPAKVVLDLKKKFWAEVKDRRGQRGLNMNLISFVYYGVAMNDDSKLSDYNFGCHKIPYVFVAYRSVRKTGNLSHLWSRMQIKQPAGTESISLVPLSDKELTAQNAPRVLKFLHATSRGIHDGYMVVEPDLSVADMTDEYVAYVKMARNEFLASRLKFCLEGRILKSNEMVGDFAKADKTTELHVVDDDEATKSAKVLSNAERTMAMMRTSDTFQQHAHQARQTLPERSSLGKRRLLTYHSLDELAKGQRSVSSLKSLSYTADVLKEKPSGQLGGDVTTPVHILRNLFSLHNEDVEFYDSREEGMEGMDSSTVLQDIFLKDKPMILRLSHLRGLAGAADLGQDDASGLAEMQAAIESETVHPVVEDVKIRLAQSLNVPAERIRITEVFQGSACFQYTVNSFSTRDRQRIVQQDTSGRLRAQFEGFQSLQVHPLLFRPAFDVAKFDTRGNKSFVDEATTYQIGPPRMKETYRQPRGWYRFGLLVLIGEEEEDAWLHPFSDERNWWRAFYGTGKVGYGIEGVQANLSEQITNLADNVVRGAAENAMQASSGPGVHCSPCPRYAEANFAARVPLYQEGQSSPKWFKVMLQVGVRPTDDTLINERTDKLWAVRSSEWIRPYGILFKED